MKRLFIILLTSGIVFCSAAVSAQSTNYKAYAVFLYSFSRYVEWPEEKKTGEFIIAIWGSPKLAAELQSNVAGRKSHDQAIKIIEVNTLNELQGAHIVFISDSKSSLTEEIAASMKDNPVLIVTERDGLLKKGAGISFLVNDDKTLNFQLNEASMVVRRLRVSTALSKLAVKGAI